MDPILNFLSINFIIFSLAIAALNFIIKTIVEYVDKAPKSLELWENVVLMVLPIIVGGLAGAMITSYPYPIGFTSAISRVIFGVVAGLLAGTLGRVVISMLRLLAQNATNPTAPPPADPPPMSPPPQ